MGNVCSFSISCDAVLSRCLDCTIRKAAYVSELEANLADLQTELQKLIEARNDVLRKVMVAEQRRVKRTDQVQGWLSRVEAVETTAGKLIGDGPQETEKLCLGGCCSKDFNSSYKFGKQVVKALRDVKTLEGDRFFEVVAEIAPDQSSVADERPTEAIVIGLESTLEDVWRCLVEESAGIIGLYGMGGVGKKTTLLTRINNKFLESPSDFDCVIWVVVSKDLQIEKNQEIIGKKIGLFDDSWKNKNLDERALEIFKILREKKFVLLLDDIWERVNLNKVGVPLPSPQSTTASKVVFTTRFINVCGSMEAHRNFKVECLTEKHAWELFQMKVGEETLKSHPHVFELAQVVAKECGGLPLALITIGRAMAYKKTPEEWKYAIEVLRRSTFELAGLEKEVYPLLKFSYDCLPNDIIRSCFLYCCLYQEDWNIFKRNLIDCWIGEGVLEENDRFGAHNQGYYIVGTLVHACLLEEVEDDKVKMHDVIRDMALWIASEIEKEKENILVYAGTGLAVAPGVEGWEKVKRLSLMKNHIKHLPDIPTCPHLLTLFLSHNQLRWISEDFFQFMPSLKVLNLSFTKRHKFPSGISKLASLQLIDLSYTSIRGLPEELKALINLKCLNLDQTKFLVTIPRHLISSFSMLHVLRMFGSGSSVFHEASGDSILFDGGELLADELLGLKYLEVLDITLRSRHALQSVLSSHKLRSCTQAIFLQCFKGSKSIYAAALADLKHLQKLCISQCEELEELKIDCTGEVKRMCQPYIFQSLNKVQIYSCPVLKDLTFLVFAPNLKSIDVRSCSVMEEIVSAGKSADIAEMMGNMSPFAKLRPFAKLQNLQLVRLQNLKSIYWKLVPFPHLKEIIVHQCNWLKKLPLDSNSAKEHKIVIHGEECWWNKLQWENDATKNAFFSCFKPLDRTFMAERRFLT